MRRARRREALILQTMTVKAELRKDVAALFSRMLEQQGRSSDQIVNEALLQYLEREAMMDEHTREGLQAIEAGETIPHEEMLEDFDWRP